MKSAFIHKLTFLSLFLSVIFIFSGCCSTEPATSCCICSGQSYYAPCLINLSTGTITELKVFDSRMIEPVDTYSSYPPSILSCSAIEDTGILIQDIGVSCSITVPFSGNGVNVSYLCERCMSKIAETSTYGYILADLEDPNAATFYEISENRQHTIRCYDVNIRISDDHNFEIMVVPGNNHSVD